VLAEIVRSHYEHLDLSNQKMLAVRLEDRYKPKPNQGTLASDVNWLKKHRWIKKQGNAIKLRKRDYEFIADSSCAIALHVAAAIQQEDRSFQLDEWVRRCTKLFETSSDVSSGAKVRRYEEFLEEFFDSGYIAGRVKLSDPVAHFDLGRWNEDWFYLEIAKDAKLHRPFDRRRRPALTAMV